MNAVTANAEPVAPNGEQVAAWVATWVAQQEFTPVEVDCATTVMLKILDGKCKMKPLEKVVMTHLYDQLKWCAGELLPEDIHSLIAVARQSADEAMKEYIYEKRVLAETMISRPVMKTFKATIRRNGLFGGVDEATDTAEDREEIAL